MTKIIHEFNHWPDFIASFYLPKIIIPDTFVRNLITENFMDAVFNPYIELKLAICVVGLEVFQGDTLHICLNLN